MSNVNEIIREADVLFDNEERNNSDPTWSQLTEYMLPSQHGIFNRSQLTPGTRKDNRRFDSTAIQAAFDLAASLNDTLTNRATKWLDLRFQEDDLNNNDEATEWMEDAVNKMLNALDTSNFYGEIAKGYQSLVVLGNLPILMESKGLGVDGRFSGLRSTALHIGETAWLSNSDGIVDHVVRKFKLSAKQALERFPEVESDCLERAMEKDPSTLFEFYHIIKSRPDNQVKIDENGLSPSPDKRPVASLYVLRKAAELVEEGGFYEFPAPVARWAMSPREEYGSGPGLTSLPDVRSLNKYIEIDLQSRALAARPPLITTQRNALGNLNLRPGRVSYVKDPNAFKDYVTQARFDINMQGIQDLRQRIRSVFLLDKLLLPPRNEIGEMTAFETAQRVQEMQRILGPTFSRLNDELLTPIVQRVFNIMDRENAFKPKPSVIREAMANGTGGLKIEYSNPLARAQKIEELTSIQQWGQIAAGLAQINKPEATDWINADEAMLMSGRQLGVPEKIIANKDEVQQIREQRAQQQQQQQQMEQAVAAADVQAKTAGTSNPDGSNQ